LGSTNDEGWLKGQCRFSKLAPGWGEFYEIIGNTLIEECPKDWIEVGSSGSALRHFLFYLRDEQFEAEAESCSFKVFGQGEFSAGFSVPLIPSIP